MNSEANVTQQDRPTTPNDRLLKADQVADRLALSPSQVRRMAQDKVIPSVRLSVRSLRFRPADIEAFIEARAAGR